MPTARLIWRLFTSGLWLKGPRENNPEGSMRRAFSVHPLRTGSIRSRSGHTEIQEIAPHSLFKAFGKRIAGVATDIYVEILGTLTAITLPAALGARNGDQLTFVAGPPTVSVPDWVFVAGGIDDSNPTANLIKLDRRLDTDAATQWGLDPPNTATPPDAALGTRASRLIQDTEDFTEWTASVRDAEDNDDTAAFPPNLTNVTGRKVVGTNSLRFRAAKNRTTRIDVGLDDGGGGPLDLTVFDGPVDSADEDYIELWIAVLRPKRVVTMELSFLVGASTPADFDDSNDHYMRTLNFRATRRSRKKRLRGTGDFIRKKDIEQALIDGRIDKVDYSLGEFIAEDEISVAHRVWVRVTIPKASFETFGNAGSPGFTWENVVGLRLAIVCNTTGSSRIWVDRIRMIGGTGMVGDYSYMFTFFNEETGTRSNPSPKKTDTNDDIIYDPVVIRDVDRQPVVLGAVDPLPAPTDPQVTHIEIWRTVGNGTALFLADRVESTSIAPETTYTDQVADYPGMFTGGTGVKFLQPEELPDDNDRPVDTLADVAGPFLGRLWLTRGDGGKVWYSPIGRLEAAQNFLPVGSAESPQKLVIWNGELYCFTERSIFRLVGTDEPFVFIEVYGSRGTTRPFTVQPTPWGVLYQANDGIRVFDGLQSQLISDDALAPIFRGGGSDGIAAFDGTVSTNGRNEYFISDANVLLSFSPDGGWRASGTPCLALFYEPDTGIVLGTLDRPGVAATTLVSIEGSATGETDTPVETATLDVGDPLDSTFEIETGRPNLQDAYKGAGVWGIVQRLYIEGQTNGQSLTVTLILDNAAIVVGTISTPTGIKRVMELGIQRAGWITGVRLTSVSGLTSRIEISSIEADVYVP